MKERDILDEQTLYESGGFKRVRRFLRGHHVGEGLLTQGWSGPETIQEVDLIQPVIVVHVKESTNDNERKTDIS